MFPNILFNALTSLIYVILNVMALNAGYEETFVALAVIYGLTTTVGNALFIHFFLSKKR